MIVRGADVELSRWANGRGHTRELYGDRGGDGSPRWRLSMALLGGAGEFSALPGVQRSLVLVRGSSHMRWGDDAGWVAWSPGDPVTFDGALPVRYRDADAEDLGCMVWGGPAAALEWRTLMGSLNLSPERWRAAVVVDGEVRASGPEGEVAPLHFRDTVVCDADYALHADEPAAVVLVAR